MAQAALEKLQKRWTSLSGRERQGVTGALLLVGLALVWFVLVAPAQRTLKQAPLERARLDTQLQTMQTLQNRAEVLQAQSAVNPQEALRDLQASVAALGPTAKVQVLGEQVTVQLQQTAASTLAQWLSSVNAQAGLEPQQVHLQRSPDAASWTGSLVFKLPRSANP